MVIILYSFFDVSYRWDLIIKYIEQKLVFNIIILYNFI